LSDLAIPSIQTRIPVGQIRLEPSPKPLSTASSYPGDATRTSQLSSSFFKLESAFACPVSGPSTTLRGAYGSVYLPTRLLPISKSATTPSKSPLTPDSSAPASEPASTRLHENTTPKPQQTIPTLALAAFKQSTTFSSAAADFGLPCRASSVDRKAFNPSTRNGNLTSSSLSAVESPVDPCARFAGRRCGTPVVERMSEGTRAAVDGKASSSSTFAARTVPAIGSNTVEVEEEPEPVEEGIAPPVVDAPAPRAESAHQGDPPSTVEEKPGVKGKKKVVFYEKVEIANVILVDKWSRFARRAWNDRSKEETKQLEKEYREAKKAGTLPRLNVKIWEEKLTGMPMAPPRKKQEDGPSKKDLKQSTTETIPTAPVVEGRRTRAEVLMEVEMEVESNPRSTQPQTQTQPLNPGFIFTFAPTVCQFQSVPPLQITFPSSQSPAAVLQAPMEVDSPMDVDAPVKIKRAPPPRKFESRLARRFGTPPKKNSRGP
ncbi:hypothetical protein FRB90_000452, partial [Tulasnella sp. 427]